MTIGIDASRAFVDRPTGTENYSREILEALLRVDKKNRYVLYTRPGGVIPWSYSSSSIEIHPIPWPVLWTQGGLALETWLRPVDVLFIPAHTLPVFRRLGVRTVVTVHDLGAEWLPQYHQFPQKYYLTWSTDYAVCHADAVIAVSEATRRDIIKRYIRDRNRSFSLSRKQIDSNHLYVVHEGVDTKRFHPRPEAEVKKVLGKYGVKRPYFLFVGTIQPRKNVIRVIKAFTQYCSSDSEHPVTLLLIGRRGWGVKYTLGCNDPGHPRVQFLEDVVDEDLPAFYSGAAALVFPSLYEGFGLPILEAMACGCPVITSNISSMPEVAGDAAVFVDPYSVQSITQAIRVLANDNSKRQELRKKGLKRAEQYTWMRAARETLQVLEGMVAKTRRKATLGCNDPGHPRVQ